MLQTAKGTANRKVPILPIARILICMVSLCFILIGIVYLFFPNARDDSIRRFNICAEQVYNQLQAASLPDSVTSAAEEYGNTYMIVYASPYNGNQDQYVFGNESTDSHLFRAAKISENQTEVWCSEHVLSENELHAYT